MECVDRDEDDVQVWRDQVFVDAGCFWLGSEGVDDVFGEICFGVIFVDAVVEYFFGVRIDVGIVVVAVAVVEGCAEFVVVVIRELAEWCEEYLGEGCFVFDRERDVRARSHPC